MVRGIRLSAHRQRVASHGFGLGQLAFAVKCFGHVAE
jgi:hypothetical protein